MTLQCNVLCARSGTILCGASAGVLRNLRFEQFNIVAEGGTKGPTLFHVFPRQVDPAQLLYDTQPWLPNCPRRSSQKGALLPWTRCRRFAL